MDFVSLDSSVAARCKGKLSRLVVLPAEMVQNPLGGGDDVAPRKCRPPRIGDIPKHSAVDEESPGASSETLTIPASDSRDSALDAPLDSPRNIVFPLVSGTASDEFSTVRKFEERKPGVVGKNDVKYSTGEEVRPRNFGSKDRDFCSFPQNRKSSTEASTYMGQESTFVKSLNSERLIDHRTKESRDPKSEVTIKLPSTENSTVPRTERSFSKELDDSTRIPSSPEDLSDQEFVEVRKDSALFLEEVEGQLTFREILKSRAPRVIRPRRESSGYASNLGTFDEDRRNSSSIDVLQDPSFFLKERRRSSTKRLPSRITVGRTEENLSEETGHIAADRMPTTEIYRKVSSAGLEMPNIEEVKEVQRDEASSRQESLDNLCNLVKPVTAEELSARCRLLGVATNRAVSSMDDARNRSDILSTSKVSITSRPYDKPRDVYDTTTFSESITSNVPTPIVSSASSSSSPSRQSLSRAVHQRSVPSPSTLDVQSTETKAATEESRRQASNNKIEERVRDLAISSSDFEKKNGENKRTPRKNDTAFNYAKDDVESKVHPRSIKVYQLLSTQSEDTGDGKPLLTDRRISLQISKQNDAELSLLAPSRPSDRSIGEAANISASQRLVDPRRQAQTSEGALQLNQYKLLNNIGQGSYGIVKLVYNEEDETHYAMKILSKKKLMKKAGIFGREAPGKKGAANPLAKVYREIALLKKLDHPNVVKLVEVLDDPDEDNLYLVFELVERGEVLQVPTDKPLDEETARKNFRDVVMGVEYLHYQRIVHRDIKPSNLLVDSDGRVKIADLGVSAELRACGELLSGPAGTPAFAAPETITPGTVYSGILCDVWSMGVTLYSLVTGRVPWDGAGSISGVKEAVRTEPLKFPEKPVLSDDLRDLILRMLTKDPVDRITLPKVKEHPWLTNHGTKPLPSETDNCRLPVTVTDEEVERVATRIPKFGTVILIRSMLKQRSFQRPFLLKKSGKAVSSSAVVGSLELSASDRCEETLPPRQISRNAKSERFQRAGRSNSAPDSYDWQTNGRQVSIDNPLTPVTEASTQETETEKR